MIVYVVLRVDKDSESSIQGIFANYLDAADSRIYHSNRVGGKSVNYEIEEWEVE